ncbi:MAG: AI-2E family transporter [Fimbriimonadaceae bacterium]|nr:AI-2E family transporter [Fimbriimonadaceae bacterium]
MGGWKIALWILTVALVLGFLYLVRGILLPFIVGSLVAILLDPVVRQLRRRGLGRGAAVGLVFIAFFAVITGIGFLTVPIMTKQLSAFTMNIGSMTRDMAQQGYNNNYFVRWNPKIRVEASTSVSPLDRTLAQVRPTLDRLGIPSTQSAITEQLLEPRRQEITKVVQGFFNSVLGALGGLGAQFILLLFAPLVALFLLMDFDRIRVSLPNWIPPSIRSEAMDILEDVGDVFQKYLRGIMISWALYTTTVALALTILGAPYAVLLALLFGTLYLIPIIGGMVNYVLLLVIVGLSGQSGNWFSAFPSSWAFALLLVGALFLITWIWDQLVAPNLVGSAVGLNPVVSMFVVAAGGSLFGILGMLVAFPIGGAVKVILERVLKVTNTTGSDTLGLPATPLRHRAPIES